MAGVRNRDTMTGRLRRRAAALLKCRADLGVLSRDLHITGVTLGRWSISEAVAVILETVGPADVAVCTWAVGSNEVRIARQWIDAGTVTGFRLMADGCVLSNMADRVPVLVAELGAERVRFIRNHSKFAVVRGGKFDAVFRGSLNWNENIRNESFDLSFDPKTVAVFGGVFDEAFASVPADGVFERKASDLGGRFLEWCGVDPESIAEVIDADRKPAGVSFV